MSCGTINTDIQRFVANMQTVDTIVNGDPLTTVTPGGKTVDTLAGYDKQFNDALDLIGWTVVDSFETGATITTRNEAVRYAATGELYRWDGTLPKTVAPGSTPLTAGGIGAGKWLLVVNQSGAGGGIVYEEPPVSLVEGVTYFNPMTFEMAFSYDDGDTTQYVTFPLAKPLGGGGGGSGEANTASNLGAGTGLFVSKEGIDLQFRSISAGPGITLSSTSTTLTINGSGEANTASNLGAGTAIFASKLGTDLQFKTLVAGTGVTLNNNASTVTINAPGTGEANTASNIGTGTAVFSAKNGVDLQFKTLVAGSGVTISNNSTTITISSTGGGGGGGTSDHAALINRDAVDQHPTSAITGLDVVLAGKASTDVVTTSVNGLMSVADKTKLDGIAVGATANSADAILLNRANHTGTQAISTVSGLQTALDARQPLDGDLTAIAALSTNGVPQRTGADTWSMLTDVKGIVISTTAPTDTTKLWMDIN